MLEELRHLASRALCALVALGGAIGAYRFFTSAAPESAWVRWLAGAPLGA